jgi:hypothetical protein
MFSIASPMNFRPFPMLFVFENIGEEADPMTSVAVAIKDDASRIRFIASAMFFMAEPMGITPSPTLSVASLTFFATKKMFFATKKMFFVTKKMFFVRFPAPSHQQLAAIPDFPDVLCDK